MNLDSQCWAHDLMTTGLRAAYPFGENRYRLGRVWGIVVNNFPRKRKNAEPKQLSADLRIPSSLTADDTRGCAGRAAHHAGRRNVFGAALGSGKTAGARASGTTALSAARHTADILVLDAGDAAITFAGCFRGEKKELGNGTQA